MFESSGTFGNLLVRVHASIGVRVLSHSSSLWVIICRIWIQIPQVLWKKATRSSDYRLSQNYLTMPYHLLVGLIFNKRKTNGAHQKKAIVSTHLLL